MAGSAEPPREAELSPPSTPAALICSPRQVGVQETPSQEICVASGSTSSLSSGGEDRWADLLHIFLYKIIALFSSFHDFLAVASTCRSWRSAAFSFPPVHTFTFPPLHLKPGSSVRSLHQHRRHMYIKSLYKWQLGDPAKTNLSLHRSGPQNIQCYNRRYMGCSYGYFIFSCGEQFVLVDVYTCALVKPPKLQANHGHGSAVYYGTLTAPLSSPSSCLLLCYTKSIFQWQVGTNSWTEHPLVGKHILQIVSFKRQLFAMDGRLNLNTITLAPQFSVQEVAVVWGEDMVDDLFHNPWLVVCGEMLLMVAFFFSYSTWFAFEGTFQVFHLDFNSVEPAKWVKMEKLDNWALFLSLDRRSPSFSCMSPESWGGKSNCVYISSASKDSDEPWIAVQLGQIVSSTTLPPRQILRGESSKLESLWVLPSLVYGVDQ